LKNNKIKLLFDIKTPKIMGIIRLIKKAIKIFLKINKGIAFICMNINAWKIRINKLLTPKIKNALFKCRRFEIICEIVRAQ
jgi:hypothetical protein